MTNEALSQQTDAEEIKDQDDQQSVGDTSAAQNSSESAEDSDQKSSDLDESQAGSTDSDAAEDESAGSKGKKSTREFIRQLQQEKYDAIEQAERLEKEKAELAKKVAASAEPNPDDFEDPKAYAEKYTEWKKDHTAEAPADSGSNPYRASLVKAGFSGRDAALLGDSFIEAQANHDDYYKVVTTNQRITPSIIEGLVGSENPGEALHYIATNPAAVDSLQGLTDPRQIAAEIGRIEERMKQDSVRNARTESTGTTVVQDDDVTGGGPVTTGSMPGKVGSDEWYAELDKKSKAYRR